MIGQNHADTRFIMTYLVWHGLSVACMEAYVLVYVHFMMTLLPVLCINKQHKCHGVWAVQVDSQTRLSWEPQSMLSD